MRTILHVDMNSYFASVEQQVNPLLRGKPVGVIKAPGRNCVIAASIEAKKFGVKTGTAVWEARKLCPQIILVPSDMDKYLAVTKGLLKILAGYSPTVEVFSIDEAFVEVTDSQSLWSGGALQMALEIKQRIKEELGEWLKCSVGISFTKLLAKLASQMHKPDGLTWLTPENYLQETERVEVSEVCGIGYSRARWLRQRGLYTLGQARRVELPGGIADLVWLRVDELLITAQDLSPAKSVSRTYTTFEVQDSMFKVQRLMRNLVEEVAAKLREMKMEGRTFGAGFLGEGGRLAIRKTMRVSTDDPLVIYKLLKGEYEKRPVVGVRWVGIWTTNLTFKIQGSMFNGRREEFLRTVDGVNGKWGLFTLYPASLLGDGREGLIRPEATGYLGDKYYRFGRSLSNS